MTCPDTNQTISKVGCFRVRERHKTPYFRLDPPFCRPVGQLLHSGIVEMEAERTKHDQPWQQLLRFVSPAVTVTS